MPKRPFNAFYEQNVKKDWMQQVWSLNSTGHKKGPILASFLSTFLIHYTWYFGPQLVRSEEFLGVQPRFGYRGNVAEAMDKTIPAQFCSPAEIPPDEIEVLPFSPRVSAQVTLFNLGIFR